MRTQTIQRVAILGSTGSIGVSTLEVMARHPERFEVFALTASTSVDTMLAQCSASQAGLCRHGRARRMDANCKTGAVRRAWPRECCGGRRRFDMVAGHEQVDTVMAAIVGAAGLAPVWRAARAGKRLLLANKEALVVGGAAVHGCGGARAAPSCCRLTASIRPSFSRLPR